MIEKHLAEEVLALATSTGGDFGEIYMEDTVAHGVSMRSSAVEQVNSTRKAWCRYSSIFRQKIHLCVYE